MQEQNVVSQKPQPSLLSAKERVMLMQAALYAGELLVKNGAEMYRVEETITKMCESRGEDNITPFITPTILFIADEKSDSPIGIKNIKKRSNNVNKIALVNDFSRKFVANVIRTEDALAILKEIDNDKPYPYWLVLISACLGCGMFAVLLNGKFGDFVATCLASCFAVLINDTISKDARTVFTGNFFASMWVTLVSVVFFQLELVANLDSIIVASALVLVPGLSFTAGVRDFISGDLISGIARIGDAILVAVAISFGAGAILTMYSAFGGF